MNKETLYTVTGVMLDDDGAYYVDEKKHLTKEQAKKHYKFCKETYDDVLCATELY